VARPVALAVVAIATLATTLGFSGAGGLAGETARSDERVCPPGEPPRDIEWANRGVAHESFPIVGAARTEHGIHVISRNIEPSQLATLDLDAETVTQQAELPHGLGAWGVTSVDGQVYAGQYGAPPEAADLYRVDPSSGEVEGLAALDGTYVWDLDADADGVVLGLDSPASLFAVDGDEVRELDTLGVDLARSLAAERDQALVGGRDGGTATLHRVERPAPNGGVEDVLPDALADHRTVYTVEIADGVAAFGTDRSEGAALAVGPADDPGEAEVVTVDDASTVDAIEITEEAVFATIRPSGEVLRHDRDDGELRRLGAPLERAETRELWAAGDELVGVSGGDLVWRLDRSSGEAERLSVVAAGADGGPELIQSIAAGGGRAYAAGSFGASVREVGDDADDARHLYLPGEAKATAVDEKLAYFAMYPGAQLMRHREGDDETEQVAQMPRSQNRPTAISVDAQTGVVAVTSGSDAAATGMLHLYDPDAGELTSIREPFSTDQRLATVTTRLGVAYVGGQAADPFLAAYDLRRGVKRWERQLDGFGAVTGLSALGDRIVAGGTHGELALIDRDEREVLERREVGLASPEVALTDRMIFAAGFDRLLRVDPEDLSIRDAVLEDLPRIPATTR
jgi:hypothetical protein